jgi:hypothetical protein
MEQIKDIIIIDAQTTGVGASAFTNTSAPQTIGATLALDAAVRDAIVYLVSNASELVDRTLDRLPDAASEVCSCGGVPAGAASGARNLLSPPDSQQRRCCR